MAVSGKFDYARQLAASLCYVGWCGWTPLRCCRFPIAFTKAKPAAGDVSGLRPFPGYLEALKPGGTSDFMRVSRQFLNDYPQRGLVIVISDFLDEGDCHKALQYVADYGNELMLIQLWADEDRTPPWTGEFDFVDAESQTRLHIHVDSDSRKQYTEAFDKFSESLKTLAIRNNGKYTGLATSMPLEDAIFGSMMRTRSIA